MSKTFLRSLPLFVSCFATTAVLSAEICQDGKKHYRASIRHIENGGIGYSTGYTTLETFLSANPNQWAVTPFLDARGHVFDNGKLAANAGIGLRKIWGQRAYGINAYYDYRNTHRLNCNQIGVGLETLGPFLDFRINGYFPVGKKVSRPWAATFSAFSGHYMLVSQKYQFAMKGADAEFGFHFGKSECFDFYAAAGPYYYRGYIGPNAWGGKARIAGMYKELISLELSDSYDRTFHNKFQGQLSFNFPFGPKAKVKRGEETCAVTNTLAHRMLQPVGRQEIVVVDKKRKNSVATDPATGLPYFFVFVNNTSSSDGTYESPYHSLAQAQANSSPNNIIYVFPGNGTTTGMDSGISLKASQKFWGSGVSHLIQTSEGTISIPAQSSSWPTITNTNSDTEGNAISLATNNAISGFIITSALIDAIYGTDPQSLEVSSCIIKNSATFAIEASFPGSAFVSLTNNQFLNNVNGVSLALNGTSTVNCFNNTFTGQTSPSNPPIEIAANSNTLAVNIKNNIFNSNAVGSIKFSLNNVVNTDISVLNNMITNNDTGSESSLGSSFAILSTGTIDRCSITLRGNTFSGNTSSENTCNSLYLHTSGTFTTLEATVTENTLSNNEGSALVFATPVDIFTLVATNNTMTGLNNNGIAVISSGTTSTGNININNNTITDIGNLSNGIVINQGIYPS